MMDNSRIIPLTTCDHQKCYLDATFMKDNSVRAATYIKLAVQRMEYMCQAWPKSRSSAYTVEYSTSVYRLCDRNSADVCDMEMLRPDSAEIVHVSVIVSDLRNVPSIREEWKLNPSKLEDMCKQLMYKVCVSNNFIIDFKHWQLAKLYGISHIVINSCDLNEDKFVIITENSKVIVDNIRCREHFLQVSERKELPPIGGLESVCEELQDLIMMPFHCLNHDNKLSLPRGILLRGPPGTGKTSVVMETARRCGAFLITINGPEVTGARPGETEENMLEVFERASAMGKEGPCMLFVDEIDSLCPRRWKSGDADESRATSLMLSFFDKIESSGSLVIIAATNRPAELDPSLRRPGRFDKEIMINVPTFSQRRDILRVHSEKFDTLSDLDLDRLAAMTNGYVGADLAAVCNEAAYAALSEYKVSKLKRIETKHFIAAIKKVLPSVQKGSDITIDVRPVTWEDIGGLKQIKLQLQQAVEWPIKHPEAFRRMGLPYPSGVLLHGPPGCCKTTLVRAAATACGATFLAISGAQLYSPFVGDSEKVITELFQRARAGVPSIIFLDEVDSIIGKRGDSSSQRSVQERVLSTLLNEMDGVGIRLDEKQDSMKVKSLEGQKHGTHNMGETEIVDNRSILVVAATNRPDMLDEALTRPGRLDRVIYVPPPDTEARLLILNVHTKNISLHEDVDLEYLANHTQHFTGADLENLCREAALNALTENLEAKQVTMEHFKAALASANPSLSKGMLDYYQNLCASKKLLPLLKSSNEFS